MAVQRRVVVVGSGAAGMAAATEGAAVTALERGDHLGGTTAISGAGIWIPDNHCAAAANPFGCAYPGGATVGPALVFGWLAGETAAAST